MSSSRTRALSSRRSLGRAAARRSTCSINHQPFFVRKGISKRSWLRRSYLSTFLSRDRSLFRVFGADFRPVQPCASSWSRIFRYWAGVSRSRFGLCFLGMMTRTLTPSQRSEGSVSCTRRRAHRNYCSLLRSSKGARRRWAPRHHSGKAVKEGSRREPRTGSDDPAFAGEGGCGRVGVGVGR